MERRSHSRWKPVAPVFGGARPLIRLDFLQDYRARTEDQRGCEAGPDAEGLLGKHRGTYRKSTPLNEGLADYFAAVVGNQSRMLDPAVRQVKNGFTSSDWAKLGDKGYHDQGQVISGFLWQLRKNVNRQSRTPWGDISPVDRLAVVAHRDYTAENFGESEAVTLKTWIGAMLKADKKMNKGKYAALIRSVGEQRLGTKLADPKASKPPRSSAHRPEKGR